MPHKSIAVALALTIFSGASVAAGPPEQQAPQQQQQQIPSSNASAASPIPPVGGVPAGLTREQFLEVMLSEMPLLPEQIREIHKRRDDVSRAAAERPRPMPKPVFSSVSLGFQPGAVPHPVRTDANTVTNLVFTDSSGAPWPVVWSSVGDMRQFDLIETKEATEKKSSNILTIVPKTSYGVTNLSVMLQDAPAPIILSLLSGQREVDYRLDVMIKGRSPNSKVVTSGGMDSINSEMMAILDGVPPPAAKALSVHGGDAEAWRIGNRIFLRTSLKIMSPAPLSAISSAGGTSVYEVPEVPLVLAINANGAVHIKITGY